MEADGKSVQETYMKDVKIMVVGNKHCGKTTFIETFAKRDGNLVGSEDEVHYATSYQCMYNILTESQTSSNGIPVKIIEIMDRGYDYDAEEFKKLFLDSTGIIFMYAIDDSLSYQEISRKWNQILIGSDCRYHQATILVANKKDRRKETQLIRTLARDNQAPVTHQQGKDLKNELLLDEFFEIAALDENDRNIREAFHYIVEQADVQHRFLLRNSLKNASKD